MEDIKVQLPGREEIALTYDTADQRFRLTGVGGPELLELLVEWRGQLIGEPSGWKLPEGSSAAAILLREVILRAQGRWDFPYQDDELCHCRAVATKLVDMAVVAGAHTPEEVSQQTSASTACGTCRPNVQAIINYRLQQF